MLSFEELAVLLSLDSDFGQQKLTVATHALKLYSSGRFDEILALKAIDRLKSLDLLSRDTSGYHFLTPKGQNAIKATKEGTRHLMKAMLLGV